MQIRFRPGMKIDLRDLRDVRRYELKKQCGQAPFTVLTAVRTYLGPHPQLLTIADRHGNTVMSTATCRREFSGIWFRVAA